MAEELVISARGIARAVVDELNSLGVVVPRLMTLKQAASYLGMPENSLRHKQATGKIPSVNIDRNLRFDKSDLDRLIEDSKRHGT